MVKQKEKIEVGFYVGKKLRKFRTNKQRRFLVKIINYYYNKDNGLIAI